jgi:hypothetical protein
LKANHWDFFFDSNPQIRRIGIFALAYLICLLAIALILSHWKFLFNALLGGIVSLLNFLWIKQTVDGILAKKDKAKIFRPALKYALRLGLMAVVIYVIINFTSFHVVGFVLGFSAVVAGVIMEGIYQITKGKHIGKE